MKAFSSWWCRVVFQCFERCSTFLNQCFATYLYSNKTIFAVAQMNNCIAFKLIAITIMNAT